MRPLRADGDGSFVGVPMLSARNVIGALSARDPRPGYFTSEHEDWLTLWAALAAPHIEVARLARLSHVDALTGALNRHGLEAALSELAPAWCVALVDIDHFKRVNDRHGHTVGDEVLRRVAQLLLSSLRATDVVVRWGGEEFLVVLPGVPLEQAHLALERARLCLASAAVHPDVHVTVSAGVAERHAGEGHKDVIARADAALYQAKRGGRNTVRRA